jgi:hypothetical protein
MAIIVSDFNNLSDKLKIVYQRLTGSIVDYDEISTNKITSLRWLDLYDRAVYCANIVLI